MPLTWFAHQVPVIGMKLARRRWFDATAMCIGSMVPDLMYSFSGYVSIDTHRWPAAFSYGLPFGIALTLLVRHLMAPVLPLMLPDTGPFRLRSYAVLATRRPPLLMTVTSVTLGIGSHVASDWFTHPGRPGARWLRYENVEVTVLGVTEPLASVLQLLGHSLGSLGAVLLLLLIGRRRLLERWYGDDAVRAARSWSPTVGEQTSFWVVAAIGTMAGLGWGSTGEFIELIQRIAMGAIGGGIAASLLLQTGARRGLRVSTESTPAR